MKIKRNPDGSVKQQQALQAPSEVALNQSDASALKVQLVNGKNGEIREVPLKSH